MAQVSNGSSAHLGAALTPEGFNFCVYSKFATRVELVHFDREDEAVPGLVVELDPVGHRTYHYWHGHLAGVGPGQIDGYRLHGPWQPERGLRFDGATCCWIPMAWRWSHPLATGAGGAAPARGTWRRR